MAKKRLREFAPGGRCRACGCRVFVVRYRHPWRCKTCGVAKPSVRP